MKHTETQPSRWLTRLVRLFGYEITKAEPPQPGAVWEAKGEYPPATITASTEHWVAFESGGRSFTRSRRGFMKNYKPNVALCDPAHGDAGKPKTL